MKILFVTNDLAEGVDEILVRLKSYGEIVGVVKTKDTLLRFPSEDVDLVISDRVNFLFPRSFLEKSKTIINTHPSLLPQHRGSYPIFWTCILRDRAGVSVHIVDEGIDTGPVIYQSGLEYSELETFREVHANARREIIKSLEIVVASISKSIIFEKLPTRIQSLGVAHKKAETLQLLRQLPSGWDTPIVEARRLLKLSF